VIEISDMLAENPVVAAIRDSGDLERAVLSKVKIVFVLHGNIINIPDICKRLSSAGKIVFVHADMIDGLKGDMAGIEYLKKYARPDGILSTKTNVIKYSKQLGFLTILRVFILDSLSLKTGIKNINETNPNAVEIMPALACKIINDMEKQISVPVIAGGLIVQKEQVMESLSAGAVAISTTRSELWEL